MNQAGDIHESYTLKIKDVLITKLIHVLQNKIRNKKTKVTILASSMKSDGQISYC